MLLFFCSSVSFNESRFVIGPVHLALLDIFAPLLKYSSLDSQTKLIWTKQNLSLNSDSLILPLSMTTMVKWNIIILISLSNIKILSFLFLCYLFVREITKICVSFSHFRNTFCIIWRISFSTQGFLIKLVLIYLRKHQQKQNHFLQPTMSSCGVTWFSISPTGIACPCHIKSEYFRFFGCTIVIDRN